MSVYEVNNNGADDTKYQKENVIVGHFLPSFFREIEWKIAPTTQYNTPIRTPSQASSLKKDAARSPTLNIAQKFAQ